MIQQLARLENDRRRRTDQIDLRLRGQASVIAYPEGHGVLRVLGKFYIRLMSWFSFVY